MTSVAYADLYVHKSVPEHIAQQVFDKFDALWDGEISGMLKGYRVPDDEYPNH